MDFVAWGLTNLMLILLSNQKLPAPLGKITCPLVTCPLEKVTCPQKKLPAVAGKNGQKVGVMANKKPMAAVTFLLKFKAIKFERRRKDIKIDFLKVVSSKLL